MFSLLTFVCFLLLLLLQPYFTQVLEESLRDSEGKHNLIFASNPCRIHHAGQEIVVFRDDLQNKMRRHDLSHVFQVSNFN